MTAQQSETLAALGAALVKAQAEMPHALKDAKGQVGQNRNYKYAPLETVVDTFRPILAKHGLSVLQRPQPCDNGVLLVTTLLHESGEWINDGGLHMPAAKNDAQAFGSALTYARRYSLTAMLGIATDDDDGSSATAASREPAAKASVPVNAAPATTLDALRSRMTSLPAAHRASVSSWMKKEKIPGEGMTSEQAASLAQTIDQAELDAAAAVVV